MTRSSVPVALLAAHLLIVAALTGCATTRPLALSGMDPVGGGAPRASSRVEARGDRDDAPQIGFASYYGADHDGNRTASGERFDMHDFTAAHRTLPFGTKVRVTNLDNGRATEVRINDRGPFKKGRIIDVSYAAARKLGLIGPGTARVRLEVR